MPDPTSPDDEFADLFQKLPDPRVASNSAAAGQPTTEAPGSRRAAREASAQQAESAPAAAPATPAPTSSSAGLEDLFTGKTTTQDLGHLPPPPNKRKRRVGGWIALGVVLVLLGGIAAGGLWVWNTYETQVRELMGWEEPLDYADGMATGDAVIEVVDGDTGQSISPKLYEAGVTMTPEAFYWYLVDTGQNPPFVPGVFALQKQMTSEAALAAILDPENKLENSAVIPEGRTVENTIELLSEGMDIPLEDFQAAVENPADYGVEADSLEGWLFPAMYTVNPDTTAAEVIQQMVDRTVTSLDNADVPEADRQEILTIASIIQREARFEDDFYKVSRVIQNRLSPDNQETFGKLQMDSTAQYGYGEMHDGTVSSSAEALADDNPWNTYVHTGLPVGPIPGDLAIDAAMHPADGDWLYFVTVNLDTGETVFTSNLADHEAAVAQWQSWCADNPDAGVLSADATRLAVWGDPIAHSRSPELHTAAYAVLGADWTYERRQVPESLFAGLLTELDATWRGLSCTMPLKSAAFAASVVRDRRAELTGAVNTLLIDPEGPRGFNTDVGGIVRALQDEGITALDDARIVGAGATAASALVAVAELGARHVEVVARRPLAVAPLEALGERLGITVLAVPLIAPGHAPMPVTIATLPGDARLPASSADALAASGGLLVDVVYGHWPTPLAQAWHDAGAPAVSGLGMLLHQALLQVRVFALGDVTDPLDREDVILSAMRGALDAGVGD